MHEEVLRYPIGGGYVSLLEALKDYTMKAMEDLLLPTRVQKEGETEARRPPDVFKMRLPDSKAATKKAPYILHQLIITKDQQPRGEDAASVAQVRSIFCAYCQDEQEGALHLLNMMERFRLPLLKDPWIAQGKFELNLQEGMEALIYPDDTAPYYAGEMMTTWRLPPVKREVPSIW